MRDKIKQFFKGNEVVDELDRDFYILKVRLPGECSPYYELYERKGKWNKEYHGWSFNKKDLLNLCDTLAEEKEWK